MSDSTAPAFDADVVVVGAGPTGLAAALLLQAAGLSGIVLERAQERSHHPKSRGIRLRASELVKLWGFDSELREVAMPGETHRFVYCVDLSGEEIARTAPAVGNSGSWSSTTQYRVAQDLLEEALERRVVAECPSIQLRKGVTAVGLDQDEQGVDVRVRTSGGDEETVRARYAIAADGVGSAVRGLLGLTLGGNGPTPFWHSVYWRGDIHDLTDHRPAIQYYTQTGGDALVGIASAGEGDRWVMIVQRPASADRPDPLSRDDAVATIRKAVGRENLEVEVISSATFRISSDVVDSYRVGRTFLAGDAAHTLPPTGGFGINTGFADIHNLVWKLAWVLKGLAPESLLDSYEAERRPTALSNAAWSTVNAERFIALKVALATDDRAEIVRLVAQQAAHVDPIDQDLGFRYGPSPIAAEADEVPAYAHLVLGARAPHAQLAGAAESTLELFDGMLTLIVGSRRSRWYTAASAQTAFDGLQVLVIGEPPMVGEDRGLVERFDLGSTGAAIVRPDGHIAWLDRGDATATEGALDTICEEVIAGRIVGGA